MHGSTDKTRDGRGEEVEEESVPLKKTISTVEESDFHGKPVLF